MAATSNEGDGVIYAIAVAGSCIGEAKTWDLKCVFLFVTPSQKKERSRRWNSRVYSTYFAILISRQGMIRGQTSSGVESGVLNNQIEIKFYSKLDDGLSAQLFPAQKPMKKK